jgi:glycosyltransferase involved in cell wall biosynthesis
MSISICIICFNEEKSIRRCLEGSKWADEIIVVDSMSQDKTVEIVREYTDRVYQRVWSGFVDGKNFTLSKATCEWVFSLDADEEIPEKLRDEIQEQIKKEYAKEGYSVPRRSFYQGRWIKHSGFYPDRQLRLFKRDKGLWVGKRVHERVEVNGEMGQLKNNLLHYPYNGRISGQIQTIDAFSTLLAQDLHDQGKRFSPLLLLLRPPLKFIEVYLLRLGFLDGIAGFIIALSSAYAVFVRYVKLRELQNSAGNRSSLWTFFKDLL